jgi:hypothetical protein
VEMGEHLGEWNTEQYRFYFSDFFDGFTFCMLLFGVFIADFIFFDS